MYNWISQFTLIDNIENLYFQNKPIVKFFPRADFI